MMQKQEVKLKQAEMTKTQEEIKEEQENCFNARLSAEKIRKH